VDRKYSHRGYRDAEKEDKKHKAHERKPPAGGPRGADQFGPRTPRMVGTVTRARCANCGAVLTPGFDPNGTCPKCQLELHCCKQCRFFDSGAQFECTQPIPERISPKDAKKQLQVLRISHHGRKRHRADFVFATSGSGIHAAVGASAAQRCAASI